MGGPDMAPHTPPTLLPPRPSRGPPPSPPRSEAPRQSVARLDPPNARKRPGKAVALLDRRRFFFLAGHPADVADRLDDAAVAEVAGIVDRLKRGHHVAELVGVDLEGEGRGQ